eukprot:scaffold681544_cov29-Prasinocladus_malaysianus.AAC.1
MQREADPSLQQPSTPHKQNRPRSMAASVTPSTGAASHDVPTDRPRMKMGEVVSTINTDGCLYWKCMPEMKEAHRIASRALPILSYVDDLHDVVFVPCRPGQKRPVIERA